VLGTSFNINAYSDEAAIKTTLVEGAVKVSKDGEEMILKPGQQAIIGRGAINVQQADIEQTLAWKNGIFNFNDVDIKAMMRQLSRWYDVEVVYKDNVPERRFLGEMPRSMSLDAVLRVLERSNVHFSVEGKRIIVKP
jgi:transmembrane sensor